MPAGNAWLAGNQGILMKYKTAFRLGLKLIGLFLFTQHFGWMAYSLIALAYAVTFGDVLISQTFDSYEARSLISPAIVCAIGAYLFFRGEWIVGLAIPSNRPYCHDCGYELTGLPASGSCPECGTAYVRPELDTAGAAEQPEDGV
jgi:hypothetical protein